MQLKVMKLTLKAEFSWYNSYPPRCGRKNNSSLYSFSTLINQVAYLFRISSLWTKIE